MSHKEPGKKPLARKFGILLVDDHPLVRERLGDVINREKELVVCGEAEERHQAIELISHTPPDLAIIDITLKNSDGLELIKDIHARWPKLPMLVVSMHDETLYAERVLRAGARGYITKQEATRNILLAIRRILNGHIYLNERVATQILTRIASSGTASATNPRPTDLLADRELQVFELTGRGLNARQIADRLHIATKTVETYRARIREKLNLKDGTELLQLAITWTHER